MLKYLLLALVITVMPLTAEVQSQGRSGQPDQDSAQNLPGSLFTPQDKQIILEYFGLQKKEDPLHTKPGSRSMPPGLAKRDQLPPGLQKHIQDHGTLPPGLAKRELPQDLEHRLSKLAPGYERVIVDNDVLLIEATTRTIIDILTNVVDP